MATSPPATTPPTPSPVPASPAPAASPPAAAQPASEQPPASPPPGTPEAAQPITVADLKLPQGLDPKDPFVEKYLGIMNDSKLDPKGRTQAIVDLQAEIATAVSERANQGWEQTQEAWTQELTNDAEVGGPKLEASKVKVGKLLDTYGTPELRQILDLTGAGNNVHLMRFLVKVADVATERVAPPPNPATPAGPRPNAAQLIFNHPSSQPKG